MSLRIAVERLARRVWRGRWSAIAHAEFRRNVGWHTAIGVGLLAALGLGLVGWLWWLKGLAAAGAAARVVLGVAWVLAVTVNSNLVARMFALDDRLEVTEAWLLTSEHRETILWARLAGLSAPGPLLLLALAPLYPLAALGLPGGLHPLFVCGHFARGACAFGSQEPGAISFAAAFPLAAVALLADMVAAGAAGPASLSGALYQAARQRLSLLPFVGLFRYWSLFMDSVAMGLLLLVAEGGFAIAAGGWLWLTSSWPFSPAPKAVLGLAAACAMGTLLVAVRLRLMAANVRVAARRHDEALISDEPA